MSADWPIMTWGDLAELKYGKALRNYKNASGPCPVYGTNGPVGWTDKPLCPKSGVIIGRKGAYRGIHFSDKPFFVIDTAFFLQPKQNFNIKWAYYQLLTQDMNGMDSGSAIPSTSRDEFYHLQVKVPPLDQQEKIVKILSALDDKIELNRQINQTLEQIAQTIFKSWFVDFEPVKAKIAAKAAGHNPEHAAKCAISGKTDAELDQLTEEQRQQLAATAALFPDKLVESELGLVPEGWEVKKLSDVVEINPKRTLKKGQISTYLDMKNMPTQGHLAADLRLREFGSGTKFINGDTLMARITPCLENGKTAFVDFLKNGEIGWGSTEYIVMRSKEPVPMLYAYLIARDKKFRSFAIQNMTGTSGRQRVNAKSLESYPIASPIDPKFYKVFSNLISPLFLEISSNGSANRSLSKIRDGLLPKLLSGELPPP